jgi:hypothetical protein
MNFGIGERMQLLRDWRDGTFAPERAGGLPTLYILPRSDWERTCRDVARGVPMTWLAIAGWVAVAIAVGALALRGGC